MNPEITYILKECGLQDKEIKVFLFLVGKDRLSAYRISKGVGLHKSTVYGILDRLVEKRFVVKDNIEDNSFYSANEISKVISNLKTKEDMLESLIHQLSELNSSQTPNVRVLEGEVGQRQFNFDLLAAIKRKEMTELLIIGNSPPDKESSLIFIEKIVREASKLGVQKHKSYRGLWNSNLKGSKFTNMYNKFGENRFLGHLAEEAVTIIYNGKVAYLFEENEEFYLLEISSKPIHVQMKNYFELLWKTAEL